ncbi:MAG: quinone-interacting membrane-bound oxidoreductase complex subunit QmoC [Desulfovibrionaceae bacterium]
MSNPVKVQPDLKFVKELQAVGGESLKKCFQCATCSVVCPLSPDADPYPRKEMVWAQWGLKDRLVNDIDIWLCHNCGTCSDLCPRGAKPGDLLGALRNMAYRALAVPSCIGKWMSSAKFLPLLVAIPAILWGLIWSIRTNQLGTAFPLFERGEHGWEQVANGVVAYGGLFPGDYTIDPIFGATFLLMVIAWAAGVKKLLASFKDMPKVYVLGAKKEPCFGAALIDAIKYEVLQHSQFQSCGEDAPSQTRFKGHLILMYSFIALAIVTGTVATGHWGGWLAAQLGLDGLAHTLHLVGDTPMSLVSPVKLLANVGAIGLLTGLFLLTGRRLGLNPAKQGSNWYDWYLLTVIWLVAVTGVGAEIFRLIGQPMLAYPTYYAHLVTVWMLIAYLPWSKLGHLVYRVVALAYAKKVGRIAMGPRR